jgi:hypothetical protein
VLHSRVGFSFTKGSQPKASSAVYAYLATKVICNLQIDSVKTVRIKNFSKCLSPSALSKFLRVVKADIEREKKGKAGVENLARALQVSVL